MGFYMTSVTNGYVPNKTQEIFHKTTARVKNICGGAGSGKTAACVNELYSIAVNMPLSFHNERLSKFLVINARQRTLLRQEILKWFKGFSYIVQGRFLILENENIKVEFVFLDMRVDEDYRGFHCLECTAILICDAEGLDEHFLNSAIGRSGRHPALAEGVGALPRRVLVDGNSSFNYDFELMQNNEFVLKWKQ